MLMGVARKVLLGKTGRFVRSFASLLTPATSQPNSNVRIGRSPDRLGLEEVHAYQLHLIAQQRSWAHINQAVSALRFF
jgi:hypothetical protein